MQRHLSLLYRLEDDTRVIKAIDFVCLHTMLVKKTTTSLTDSLKQKELRLFLQDLDKLEFPELSSMHAVTSVMEYLALRLVFFLAPGV